MENEMTNDAAVALEYLPGKLDETAPIRVWLQIDTDGDNDERDEEWPGPEHVSWQDESIGGLEVQYVRIDLHATTVAELRAEVEAWQSQCEGLNESRREEMARADAAERRVAELLQAVREIQTAESDVRIHEAMNPRSRNYRLPIYEAQRQARERLSALTKESP